MTKINFKRAGGVLGKEIERDIDLNEIPDAESQELMQLITESNFFKIPQNLIARSIPDEYEYTVTVEAGNTHHTIQTSDSNAPESLRPLLEKLSRLARGTNTPTAE
ncbi:MAG TPA: protealysin inhibitor emfourin [Anaerolineales bacterium]|nr:protealysin inhibitor emfourin [Anaerolineales bacterium]